VTDEESASKATISWIENTLFKTTTPPDEVAAIVVEVVQGEGGYVPAPKISSKSSAAFATSTGSS